VAALFPVLAVYFIGPLGFAVVIPLLVFVIRDLGGNAFVYGLIGATYPALQLIGAPLLGRWSDVVGRRRVLLVSQAGTLVSWLVFGAALFVPRMVVASVSNPLLGDFELTLPLLVVFFARGIDGLTGGNIAVANAYVADLSSDQNRSRNFGWMGMSANLGFVGGPALASLLGAVSSGFLAPIVACVLISTVATGLILFALPESQPRRRDSAAGLPSVRRVFGQGYRDCSDRGDSWLRLLGSKELRMVFVLYFLVFLGFNFFYTAFPVHAADELGWTVSRTGLFFVALSGLMVVVQGPVLARMSRVVSAATLIWLGNALLCLNFVLLSASTTAASFAATVFFAVGNGLMWPSVLALLSGRAGPDRQGAVQGLAGSLSSLASIIGLIAGGVLYQALGATTFLVSAVLMIAASVLAAPTLRDPVAAPTRSAVSTP
jgi:MFS family permease